MKINISTQSTHLLFIISLLLILVLVFSFFVLVPKGKQYRADRLEYQKESKEVKKYQDIHTAIEKKLKLLENKNRDLLHSFEIAFSEQKFQEQYAEYFSSLKISKLLSKNRQDAFVSYEVDTRFKMSSPKSFYDFLDALNSSNWVIAVNPPISFKRENEMMQSSFVVRVYGLNNEINATKRVVE